MIILLLILLLVSIIGLVSYYLLERNKKVGDFLIEIINMSNAPLMEYLTGVDIRSSILNLLNTFNEAIINKCNNYDRFLFSCKKLKLENWFTENEIRYMTDWKSFINEQIDDSRDS